MDAISNPRKSLRLRLACPVSLASLAGGAWRWRAETRDVSAAGCCVPAPGALEAGDQVRAVLQCPASLRSLAVRATVVWCSATAPWLIGLAFAAEDRPAAAGWFDEVASAHLLHLHDAGDLVPDRLSLASRLEVGAVPVAATTLRAEQEALLHLASERASLHTVVSRLAGSWTRSQRTLFEMLGHGWVRLGDDPGAPPGSTAPPPRRPTGQA